MGNHSFDTTKPEKIGSKPRAKLKEVVVGDGEICMGE